MTTLIGVYFLLGALFGVFFVARGYKSIDPSADEASFGVRLLWLPAAIALWPVLTMRLLTGRTS